MAKFIINLIVEAETEEDVQEAIDNMLGSTNEKAFDTLNIYCTDITYTAGNNKLHKKTHKSNPTHNVVETQFEKNMAFIKSNSAMFKENGFELILIDEGNTPEGEQLSIEYKNLQAMGIEDYECAAFIILDNGNIVVQDYNDNTWSKELEINANTFNHMRQASWDLDS